MLHHNLYVLKSGKLFRENGTIKFLAFDHENENAAQEGAPLEQDRAEPVDPPPKQKATLPIETTESVFLFGVTKVDTEVLKLLARADIPVHVYNAFGGLEGTFFKVNHKGGTLLQEQVLASLDSRRLKIAKALVLATSHNLKSNLRAHGQSQAIEEIENLEQPAKRAESVDELMGYEGNIKRRYYATWPSWVSAASRDFKRVYLPPDNPVNCLISFFNGLLYGEALNQILRTELAPSVGYLHAIQSRRRSLPLDLSEPFKPALTDRLVGHAFNNRLFTDQDFRPEFNGVLLTEDGKQKAVQLWREKLKTTFFHRKTGKHVSYRELIRQDCYKLIRFLLEGEAPEFFRAQS
jgi:CRISPR-associated protein Cas1